MEKWVDTHAHYQARQFNKNRNSLLTDINKEVKSIITLGTNSKTNSETIELIHKYDFLYGMVGFFPNETWEIDSSLNNFAQVNLSLFKEQLKDSKIIGIGEIGMDFHWDCVGKKGSEIRGIEARKIQEKWFRYQLDLAKELNLPVSMHSRDAEDATLKIFEDYKSIKGIMHCFSYGEESAKVYLEKDLYFGVGGTITYPNNSELRKAITMVPIEKILLETDAPYLSPQEVRRSLNDSRNIKYVIKAISELKGISEEDVIKITNENAKTLLNI